MKWAVTEITSIKSVTVLENPNYWTNQRKVHLHLQFTTYIFAAITKHTCNFTHLGTDGYQSKIKAANVVFWR